MTAHPDLLLSLPAPTGGPRPNLHVVADGGPAVDLRRAERAGTTALHGLLREDPRSRQEPLALITLAA